MAQYRDGTIADGPNGPIIYQGGQWVPMGQPQATAMPLPVSPRTAREDQRKDAAEGREAARLRLAQQRQVHDFANDVASQNRPPAGYRFTANGALEPIPGGPADPATLTSANAPRVSAKERADAIAGYTSAGQLERLVADIERQFNAGPGATKGVYGLQDYLPTETNQRFNAAGNAARGIVGQALGFTGGQLNTATEAEQAVGPYLPNATDRDQVTRDKIARLRELAGQARSRSEAILGGVPDENGRITPNALDQTFLTGGNPGQAAAFGATEGAGEIPPAMQEAHRKWVASNIGHPGFADAYVQFRQGMDAANGFQSDPEAYRSWAQGVEKNARGGTTNTDIATPNRKLSAVDQFRNNAVNNPVGAAVAGAVDAGAFGIPSALAGDQMRALGDAQGLPMALGQIVGSIGATGAIGKGASMGLNSLARGAPRLAARARDASPFMKSLGADTAYSGIYGANTGQDPLSSAAFGAAGSAGGQAFGGALGGIAAGANTSRAAQMLRKRGVFLTAAQQMGGVAKSLEDKLTSVPGLGDLINARRLEGVQAFNRAAFDEAGRPIGARVQDTGEAGVSDLLDQIGNSYDQATAGAQVPLDPQFAQDLQRVAGASRMLPPDYQARFAQAMDNRVGPIAQAGEMTGDAYQQAVRGIKGYRASAGQAAPGFEGDYRDALSMAQDALTGQMQRGGGQDVIDGLERSNKAYRQAKALQAAVIAAKNGSKSGEVQMFMPSDLVNAGFAAQKKFPGNRPFARLADAGQSTLPSRVPDSGTAGRLATMALPGALGGTGAVAGYAGGDVQGGAATGIGVAAALSLLNTKVGQKALQKALIDRAPRTKAVGRAINKRKGLFGTATLPFLIDGN